ncbi:MAG: O-antigen ligase family protein [Kofleriaceae bacterium]
MRSRDRVAAALGASALIVSVFAVGGALRSVQAVIAGLAALSIIPYVFSRKVNDRLSPLLALIGAAALLTGLQLVPLPESLIAMLQPVGASLREDGAALLALDPSSTLTLDRPGSLRALVLLLVLLALAFVALRLGTTERGRFGLLATVAAMCGVGALIVGVHALLGIRSLYGIYEPEHARPAVIGPLLNENQLGCLMALGTTLSFGLVMYRRQPSWGRAGWIVCGAVCGAATMVSLSRGAALALFAGLAIVLGVLAAQRFAPQRKHERRSRRFLVTSLPIGVVAVCAVVIVIYASAGGISRELARTSLGDLQTPTSKYAAWRSASSLIEESPWVGVGRGAFEASFTRVHSASAFATFSHLENEYIQAVVDWGIVGVIILGLAAVWLATMCVRRWRDGPLAAAALGALAVVAIQSNVDFGLELPGLAIPIVIVAATLSYVPLRDAQPRRLLLSRFGRATLAVGLGVGVVMLFSPATTSLAEDHAYLQSRQRPTLEQIRESIERHPLDYFGYALAAQQLQREGDPRSVRVLNHALVLHPTHAGLHRMAGRLLFSVGRVDQAAIEYASALRGVIDPHLLLVEIAVRFGTKHAAAAIPHDAHRSDLIVRELESLYRVDVIEEWLARGLDLKPGDLTICELLYETAMRRGELALANLANRRCKDFEPSQQTRYHLALSVFNKGGYNDAIRLLENVEQWHGRIDEKISAWFVLCESRGKLRQWNEAKKCLRRLDVTGYLDAAKHAHVLQRLEVFDGDIKKQLAAEETGSGSGSVGSAKGGGSGDRAGSGSLGESGSKPK